MFPKYVVVITQHTDAASITAEKNEFLEARVADDLSSAKAILSERVTAWRSSKNLNGQFGPGATTIQGALYTEGQQ